MERIIYTIEPSILVQGKIIDIRPANLYNGDWLLKLEILVKTSDRHFVEKGQFYKEKYIDCVVQLIKHNIILGMGIQGTLTLSNDRYTQYLILNNPKFTELDDTHTNHNRTEQPTLFS